MNHLHAPCSKTDGLVVGCVALLAMGDGRYEVAKMAVTPRVQGRGSMEQSGFIWEAVPA